MHITGTRMRIHSLITYLSAALIAAFVAATPAQAVIVAFPDQPGATVTFTNIAEDSGANPDSLYEDISSFENTLKSSVFNFETNSNIGVVGGELSFSATAVPGQRITSVTIQEFGSWTSINGGEAEFAALAELVPESGPNVVGGDGGSFSGPGITSDLWTSTITLSGFAPSDEVFVSLQNDLDAIATTGQFAFIDKQVVLISVETVVPEPSSIAFLLGCVGFVSTRRRKRA